jgi:hypothetical protein
MVWSLSPKRQALYEGESISDLLSFFIYPVPLERSFGWAGRVVNNPWIRTAHKVWWRCGFTVDNVRRRLWFVLLG